MPKKRSGESPPTTCFLAALNAGSDGLDTLSENSAHANALTALVSVIARQAVKEALEVYRGVLEAQVVAQTSEGSEKSQHEARAKADRGRSSSSPDDRFLSVRDAAARLNVSEKTIRRKIEAGDLPARRFGRLLRICEGDLVSRLTGDRAKAAEVK